MLLMLFRTLVMLPVLAMTFGKLLILSYIRGEFCSYFYSVKDFADAFSYCMYIREIACSCYDVRDVANAFCTFGMLTILSLCFLVK
jgi:hypothetical protein